jgi:ABC-2 type transport system permease protein
VLPVNNILVILWFGVIGSGILGALGLIASIWAVKWDHIAAFQNFIILPLSFLSGVFFSIQSLSPFWVKLSFFNPFFYVIDGFRFGFLGVSETFLLLSFVVSGFFFLLVSCICIIMLKTGYKLRT